MSNDLDNLPYFAFGSNLDPDQIARRCREHQLVGKAYLNDHDLWFPRFSSTWQGGGASIKPVSGKRVWGCLYKLSAADWRELDRCEGYKPNGSGAHTKLQVTVVNEAEQKVAAILYAARVETETRPTTVYMQTIIRGARARGLPPDWLALLEGVPTQGEQAAKAEGTRGS